MTVRDADVSRLANLSGLGVLPYRSFNNAPVRRAPAPPPKPAEAARPGATVLTLSPGGGEGPMLRVIAGMGGLARPTQVNRPPPDLPPAAPAAERLAAPAAERLAAPARYAAAPGYGLLARAIGEDLAPAPANSAAPPAAAHAGGTRFPLLNAALSAGGGSPWR